MDLSGTEAAVRTFLEEQVLQQNSTGLQNDTPLLSTGVLTSLSLVRLVAFLEEEFSVEVPMEEVTGRRFSTVTDVAGLVLELRLAGRPESTVGASAIAGTAERR